MKKIIFSFITVIICIIPVHAQQQREDYFTEKWKIIDQYVDDRLPESANQLLDELYRQAAKDKNPGQIIKTKLYKSKLALQKDPDSAPVILKEFETFAGEFEASPEKSLLYAITADLYAEYYQGKSYLVSQITHTEGTLPEDINTWSKQNFQDKVNFLTDKSFENEKQLQNTSANSLKTLLLNDTTILNITPTLFDILTYKKIELSDVFDEKDIISDAYRRLIRFRKTAPDKTALIFAELGLLNHLTENINDTTYITKADSLIEIYKTEPAVVELFEAKASYLLRNPDVFKENKKKAFLVCREGISKFPTYTRINILTNIMKTITGQKIVAEHNDVVKAKSPLKLTFTTTNVSEMTVELYKLNMTAEEYQIYSNNKDLYKPDKLLLNTRKIQIHDKGDFEQITTDTGFISGNYGIYEYVCYPQEKNGKEAKISSTFIVSDFAVMYKTDSVKGKNAVYVVDRISGKPQSKVDITIKSMKWNGDTYQFNENGNTRTDSKGYTSIQEDKNNYSQYIFLSKGEDRYFSATIYKNHRGHNLQDTDLENVAAFTDRAIYRPGQIVSFKAIAYISGPKKEAVLPGKSYTFELYDVNHQLINKKTLKTNDFGSAAGNFVLPEKGLNGTYTIRVNQSNVCSFSVESYRKPTFEITFDQPEEEIHFGEPVTIKGQAKAYAGYALQDCQATYNIIRKTHPFFRMIMPYSHDIIASGMIITDDKGGFTLNFTPERNNQSKAFREFYTYDIEVSVANPAGETQQNSISVPVGERSVMIQADIPEMLEKQDTHKFTVYTQTLQGKSIEKTLEYQIFMVEDTPDFAENLSPDYTFNTKQLIAEGKFNSSKKYLPVSFSDYKQGRYKVVLKTNDSQGKEVISESSFILYDKKANRPPVKTYTWLTTPEIIARPGEKVKVKFGTSAKNLYVLWEVVHGQEVISRKWVRLCRGIKTFETTFAEKYKDGMQMNFTFIRDEKSFMQTVQIKTEPVRKNLHPKLTVFRDNLKPGETVTWTVNIPDSSGTQSPELLLSMYDAALDAIQPHQWSFDPGYEPRFPFTFSWNFNINGKSVSPVFIFPEEVPIKIAGYTTINMYGLENQLNSSTRFRRYSMTKPEMMFFDASQNNLEIAVTGAISLDKNEGSGNTGTKIRSEFNETAFFYPQLHADTAGNYNFTFTVPESLTRWNLKMLAHTKDLYAGQAETSIVAQKELMVQMNLPQFVRQSDKLILSANVTNLTDSALRTSVTIEIINPVTEQVINKQNAGEVALQRNGTRAIAQEILIPADQDLVLCRITASAGSFSDGEQQYLPILPDKVLVTETRPFSIKDGKTQKIGFKNILEYGNKVDTKSLTFEMTANPVWYAIQAMPALSEPSEENAIAYLTAWYVNTLAGQILQNHPEIARTFEQIKASGLTQETLQSALSKNQDLKMMLLQETPWVLEAKSETEQQQRIATFFRLNEQKDMQQKYLNKLAELQLSSGAFAWFNGMNENRWITQFIIEKCGSLGTKNAETAQIIKKALDYLDNKISLDYQDTKTKNKNYQSTMTAGSLQIQYLYLRSQFPEIEIPDFAAEANRYYLSQISRYYTKLGLYEQATAAITLHRAGKSPEAEKIIRSLRENAIKSDEAGMNWAKNKSGYAWNERPVTVHTRIMQAFSEISPENKEINSMKTWLLHQKQTQQWESTVSTLDAIEALVSKGSDRTVKTNTYHIQAGTKSISTEEGIPGFGYIKTFINAKDVRDGIQITSSDKNNAAPAWGAVYWQYLQNADEVKTNGNGLSVNKKLYVEKTENNQKILLPVNDKTNKAGMQIVQPGDKIISRMVISCDRDMDFVALTDMRAACLIPVNQLSGCQWKQGVVYYRSVRDASTDYFFSTLPKGTYIFEEEYSVNNEGVFSGGIAKIQCLYAPEFTAASSGENIQSKK